MPWLSELLMATDTPAGGRTRGGAGARQDSDAGGARGARAVSDRPRLRRRPPRPSSAKRCSRIGRFTTREDLAPILRWTTAADAEDVAGARRGRSSGRAIRPRCRTCFKLSHDPSAEVRFWAVRGLAPALVTEAGLDLAKTSAPAARRRPRSRSPRPDRSAARARAVRRRCLVRRGARARSTRPIRGCRCRRPKRSAASRIAIDVVVPRLVAATAADATDVAPHERPGAARRARARRRRRRGRGARPRVPSTVARTTAIQVLQKLGEAGRARLDALAADPATKGLIPQPGSAPGRPAGTAEALRGGLPPHRRTLDCSRLQRRGRSRAPC